MGTGQVIKGWDEGLVGMCLNEKRKFSYVVDVNDSFFFLGKLTIPSHKAYGKRGFGSVIPPDSTLVFTVELVGLNDATRDEL